MRKVSYIEDVALVSLSGCPSEIGFFAEILQKVAEKGVDVDMITQTPPRGGQVDLCFTLADEDVPKLLTVTASLAAKYPSVKPSVNGNNCKVSVWDEEMVGKPGYAADLFARAAAAGVDVRLISTSENDVSLLIVNDGLMPLLEALR